MLEQSMGCRNKDGLWVVVAVTCTMCCSQRYLRHQHECDCSRKEIPNMASKRIGRMAGDSTRSFKSISEVGCSRGRVSRQTEKEHMDG